jgi:hypothetical protein
MEGALDRLEPDHDPMLLAKAPPFTGAKDGVLHASYVLILITLLLPPTWRLPD